MSARERTLILKLDDTQVKDAIKRIQNAGFGTGSTGSKKSGGTDIVGQVFGKNSVIFKNLAKLTLIGAAITAIVKLVQKISESIIGSSPILQTMLKLFQTSIVFILRPIGDFIGFFLRPLLIVFLRQIALPMYKTWDPIMRNLGAWIGGGFAGELSSILGPREERQKEIHEAMDEIQRRNVTVIRKFFEDIKKAILGFTFTMPDFSQIDLSGFEISFGQYFDEVGLRIKTGFQPFLDNFDNNILRPLSDMNLSFQGMSNFISFMILGINDAFVSVTSSVSEFFTQIAEFFNNLIEGINGLIFSIPEMIGGFLGGDRSNGPTTVTNNFFEGAFQSGQDIVDSIFNFGENIQKGINDTLSGRG